MIGILIRTKNEEKHIAIVLENIYSQRLKPKEIVIVDSGSTDNTLMIAKKHPVRIFEIPPEKFTYGYAMNHGFQKMTTEYVVSLSAHAIPATDEWLLALFEIINSSDKIAAVVGREIPYEDCNPWEKRRILYRYADEQISISDGGKLTLSNANSIIRKSVWQLIKFNEEIEYAEELLWQREVLALGYKIFYSPKAVVYHSHHKSLVSFFIRQKRIAMAAKRYSPMGLTGYAKFVLRDLIKNLSKDVAFLITNKHYKMEPIVNTLFTRRVLLYIARLNQLKL